MSDSPATPRPDASSAGTSGERRRLPEPLVAVLPAVAAVVLYGGALGLWWTWDELIYLRVAAEHSPAAYLLSPAVYRELSPAFFFPGALLSFDLDLSLGGASTVVFFAHQLAVLALAAALLARLVRRWLPAGAAVATAVVFLVGVPVPTVVAELMTRHYLDGLALALGSAHFFVASVERRSRALSWTAAGLAFAAFSCKEVFVPLPLVLGTLPAGRLRDRLKALVPFAPAVAVYGVWRQLMLSGYLGAYADDATRLEAAGRRVVALGRQFLGAALGDPDPGRLALAAAVATLALLPVLGRSSSRWLAAALAVAVAGPLVPVAERVEPRFGLLPWLLVSLLVGTSVAAWREKGRLGRVAGALVLGGALAVALPPSRDAWKALERRASRVRAEGRAFLEGSAGELLFRPLGDREFHRNLAWMRRNLLGRQDPPPRVAWDEAFFCEADASALRARRYSEDAGSVLALGESAEKACESLRRRTREAPEMAVRIAYGDQVLSWQLEPAGPGSWSLVEGEDFFVFPVPARGGIGFALPRRLVVRARWDRPDGTVSYGPPLVLEVRGDSGEVVWRASGASRLPAGP